MGFAETETKTKIWFFPVQNDGLAEIEKMKNEIKNNLVGYERHGFYFYMVFYLKQKNKGKTKFRRF